MKVLNPVANKVSIIKNTNDVSFVLEDNGNFYMTGFKVLQNQVKYGFIKCSKSNLNGKVKLIYDITGLKSLDSIISNLSPERFISILANLLDVCEEAKRNGFMQCENIILISDNIYIDINNFKLYLIYLPINLNNENDFVFENNIKNCIGSLIKNNPNLVNGKIKNIDEEVKNPTSTLESIRKLLTTEGSSVKLNYNKEKVLEEEPPKPNIDQVPNRAPTVSKHHNKHNKKTQHKGILSRIFSFKNKKSKQENNIPDIQNITYQTECMGGETEILSELFRPNIKIIGIGTPVMVSLKIDKEEYIIGKSEEVDGMLNFNKAISRKHCKVINSNGQNYIIDLGSANGTYVNGEKIAPNSQVLINVGDKIKLANSDFEIRGI